MEVVVLRMVRIYATMSVLQIGVGGREGEREVGIDLDGIWEMGLRREGVIFILVRKNGIFERFFGGFGSWDGAHLIRS